LSRAAVVALAVLAAGWAASLWVPPTSDDRVNDLYVYRSFAAPVLDGELPYRDVFFEYPPLAAPAIALPGVVGTGEQTFRYAFAAWMLLAAGAVVLLCGLLAARTGGDPRRAMLAAALMPVLTGAMIRTHFDLVPVALVLASLALLVAGRSRTGMAMLGLAVMTKGFPIVAVPPALAWLLVRHGRAEALRAATVLGATIAAIAIAAVAVSPGGAWDALRFQTDRPVQIESTAASALYALDGLGLGDAVHVASNRSDGLEHPAAGAVGALVLALLCALLAVLTMLAARRPAEPRALVLSCLAAVAAFAVLGKVLSPQFLVWLVPLGALAFAWRLDTLALAVALAVALTQLEFPAHYFDLRDREPLVVALVCLRNGVLLGVLGLAVRALQAGGKQHLRDARGRAVVGALD
jgi:Glycosyltransferase family 87